MTNARNYVIAVGRLALTPFRKCSSAVRKSSSVMKGLGAIVLAATIIALVPGSKRTGHEGHVWTFLCKHDRCEKHLLQEGVLLQGLSVCKALCSPSGVLWPQPSSQPRLSESLVPLNANRVTVRSPGVEANSPVGQLITQAGVRFRSLLIRSSYSMEESSDESSYSLLVDVIVKDQSVVNLSLDEDESYSIQLKVDNTVATDNHLQLKAVVTAQTFFGARHGLETLTQLAVFDDISMKLMYFREAHIEDAPQYGYRGLLLDTSRNLIPVSSIKRTLEGMAINKLNTFHWHITDSHSWPFVSETFPQLSQYGAYSQKQVYKPDEVRELVEFARVRGVRVLPELDAPAHVGEGFQWTKPGTLVCFKKEPWAKYCAEPPCGQLNPTSEQVYSILSGVYKDMLALFDNTLFHMGGDEVNMNCWKTSPEVVKGMAALGLNANSSRDLVHLWSYFQQRASQCLTEASGGEQLPIILWSSDLTSQEDVEKYLNPRNYIIQMWTKGDDLQIAKLITKGYRLILSNYDALYLDCGVGSWTNDNNNWCSYVNWQRLYKNNPVELVSALGVPTSRAARLVLGAEAALWTEQADEAVVDSKLWPRVSALAERLWSNPSTDWKSVMSRMLTHRQRIRNQGFYPDRLQPEWCYQNEGFCF